MNRPEVTWRLAKPQKVGGKFEEKYEPLVIKPDQTLAFVTSMSDTRLQQAKAQASPGLVKELAPYLNTAILPTSEGLANLEWESLIFTFLIFEYKKFVGPEGKSPAPSRRAFVCQVAMAMVSSIHHWRLFGLQGMDWPVFGVVVFGKTVSLYVGWSNDQEGACQVFKQYSYFAVSGANLATR